MNLPNRITLTRIFLIPLVVVFYLMDFELNLLVTAIAFALISCTDFLDGTIARKYNMVTDLGKFLDPIADKVIVVVGLFLIVHGGLFGSATMNIIGTCCCMLIMSRELIIGAFRQIAASKKLVLAADNLGKIKTVATDFAIPFLFIGGIAKPHYYIGISLFFFATFMTVLSGVNYVLKNKHVLATTKTTENDG